MRAVILGALLLVACDTELSSRQQCHRFVQAWCDVAFGCFEGTAFTPEQQFIVGFETYDAGVGRVEAGFTRADCASAILRGNLRLETDGQFSPLFACSDDVDYEMCDTLVSGAGCNPPWDAWVKIGESLAQRLTSCLPGPRAPEQ